jgi:CRP-like cAMP-binding protein
MNGDYLLRVGLFRDLNEEQLDFLRPHFCAMRLAPDTVIFEQGAPAEFFYIVVEGEVLISFKPDDGPRMTVGCIRPDGVFGWSAAIGSSSYTSAAITVQDCTLLRIRSSNLRSILRSRLVGKIIKERIAGSMLERAQGTRIQIIGMLENGLKKAKSQPGG